MPSLAHTSGILSLLGEPTRVRLLSLLADEEMTVADLAAATNLGQSRVSTHLGRLRAARVVTDRKFGSATFYSLNETGMPAEARRVWALVSGEVSDATLEKDRQRWKTVSDARSEAASWPDAVAGHMDRHYSPGRTWESLARGLVGLLALGDVLDAGGGDGAVAELLAPRSLSYTLVDRNERLVRAARRRLEGAPHVSVCRADLTRLPFDRPCFDVVLLLNVLVEAEAPDAVLAALAAVLRPGGRIAVVTLSAHDHTDLAAVYRHQHLGFGPAAVRRFLQNAGFSVESSSVTSRERRPPRLQVVTAFGKKDQEVP
jgi:DNA-binding transcriptional ArsR family regulator/protein-L-isoaspartate O-methyltransferase